MPAQGRNDNATSGGKAMSQASIEFDQLYTCARESLELEILRTENAQTENDSEKRSAGGRSRELVKTIYLGWLRSALARLPPASSSPEPLAVAAGCVSVLRDLEDCDFVLVNLLEEVKRDGSLQNALSMYKGVGLVDFDDQLAAEKRNSPFRSSLGSGGYLVKLRRKLGKFALRVAELLVHAVKAVSRLESLEISPSIGWSGPLPSVSFEFQLTAESVTLRELFRLLMGEKG